MLTLERRLYRKRPLTGRFREKYPENWGDAWALFPGEVAYVWHGALHAATVAESLVVTGFDIRSQIIWAKKRLVLSRGPGMKKRSSFKYIKTAPRSSAWR